MEAIREEAAAIVERGEGDEVQLPIGREEELARLAKVGLQGTEGEGVEGLGGGQVGGGLRGERVMQAQGGAVNGLRWAQIDSLGVSTGEEQERQIAQAAGNLMGRQSRLGHEGMILVGHQLDQCAPGGQGCSHAGEQLLAGGQGLEPAKRRGALSQLCFQGITFAGSSLRRCW